MKLQLLIYIIVVLACCNSLITVTWAACPLMDMLLDEDEGSDSIIPASVQHYHRHLSETTPADDESSSTNVVATAVVATTTSSVVNVTSSTPTTAITPLPTTSTPSSSSTSKPSTATPSSSLSTTTVVATSNVTITTVVPNLFGSSNSSSTESGGVVTATTYTHTCVRENNGNCGPTKTCASQGIVGCCSEWGWCGTSEAHCGACCQHGCTNGRSPTRKPSRKPTRKPTRKPVTTPTTCNRGFTLATYDAIESDIKRLKDDIIDIKMRTHFLGGIVRLAAHDFMDYDRNNVLKLGPDGCVDFTHSNNQGLGSIWTPGAQLYELHQSKYSWISRADFWVASANAVIKITSVNNINTAYNIGYTLRTNYKWGRLDRATCVGSGTRLAIPSRCAEVEKVFLTQMGLTWTDAVALLGGHTLGRGSSNFSGHEGTWKDNNSVAQIFDKNYYSEMLDNNWRMRNIGGPANGGPPQDFTTGNLPDSDTGRIMLNTDICLAWDIDDALPINSPRCCTKGTSTCAQCPTYPSTDSRRQAANAVATFKSCTTNNDCFYKAFIAAWNKATVLGQSGANKSLTLTCV